MEKAREKSGSIIVPRESGALDSYRWVMLGLLWLAYSVFGLIHRSLAPLVTPVLADLGMSYGQMGFILGSWQLTYIILAVFAGALIDKWGVRRCLAAGIIVIALSAMGRYFATSFITLLAVVIIFGLGGPFISIGVPKTLSMWFKGKERGTAIGVYTTGSWVGGIIALGATNSIVMPLTGYNWRTTSICYGLLALGVAILWSIFAREPKKEITTVAKAQAGMKEVFATLIRIHNVRIILIAGLCSFAVVHGFTNWLPKLLETGGLSPAIAGLGASIPLIAGTPAVLTIPRLVPQSWRGRTIALLALITIAGLMISVESKGAFLLFGLILFGITSSALFPMLMLILMDTPEVGPRYMGSAGGIFFCFAEIGGFLGPSLMGTLTGLTGNFLAGVSFLTALAILIIIVMALLRNPQPVK